VNGVVNHLWQSTVFAAAVAFSCAALRRNSPRLRYGLWLAASLKFLIPFALIVSMGAEVRVPPDVPSLRAVTVQEISTYFAPVSQFPTTHSSRAAFSRPELLAAIWLSGALLLLIRWHRRWRTIYRAARSATRLPLGCAVPTFSSAATIEPGVFGIFHPVILLPAGISDNLTPQQFEAMLVHEYRHIKCRDNLTAALHMCVETLFWFHPIVWWIGGRLMDERERDCDEAVLRHGGSPGHYAQGIVRVCETYVKSEFPCAAGISGSDLKQRVREIMMWSGSIPITFWGKAALAAAAVAAISAPFLIGILRAQTLPPAPAYRYEVVSIHKSAPGQTNVHIGPGPQGGIRTENTSVMVLIATAYNVQEYQIVSAPHWVTSDHFDVMFTPEKTEIPPAPGMDAKDIEGYLHRNGQRLQAVLRDRFGLVLRQETRELPIYDLIQAPRGNKLSPNTDDKSGFPSIQTNGNTQITARNATMEMLAQQLSMTLRRPVHDKTMLNRRYDFKLEWAAEPDASPDHVSNSSPGASIFTAITEQLGLRLESKKGPVQVYVVEKIERPTEN